MRLSLASVFAKWGKENEKYMIFLEKQSGSLACHLNSQSVIQILVTGPYLVAKASEKSRNMFMKGRMAGLALVD